MNKKLKIATAAVSVVMAGTMAFGMFGCGGGNGGGGGTSYTDIGSGETHVDAKGVKVDENGNLAWRGGTNVVTSIGYQSSTEGITYHTDNSNIISNGIMGETYRSESLKPGWQKLADDLQIEISDIWAHNKDNGQASANLGTLKDRPGGLSSVDIFTTNTTMAHQEVADSKQTAGSSSLLNLAEYLDYMPNYKKFLESSDVVSMSLLASTEGAGEMYVAPYFDGNNDIERYMLLRKDVVEAMLDKELPTTGDATFGNQIGKSALTQTYATAYMGSENYTVTTTNPDAIDQTANGKYGTDKISLKENNNDKRTVEVTVNYTAALAAAKQSGSPLNTALTTAKSTLDVESLTSGNIMDLMNAVLEGNMAVSGTKLINILRAYIDVAYTVKDTENHDQPLYTEANHLTRSGVFNSACAAWDVDLYVALGRCYVASGTMFDHKVTNGSNTVSFTTANNKPRFLVSGRAVRNDRQAGLYQLMGELYGVRGMESRYMYSYIGEDGHLRDARQNTATWEAANAFAQLTKEGLVNFELAGDDYGKAAQMNNYDTLSLHDYVQTQTKEMGFHALADSEVYNMAPVVTPVSKWDTNDDGTKDTIMRFTESWRSVKTEGAVVSAAVKSNPDKLSAVLAFIDYIYSPDGQIVMTYGPQSTNGNTNPNGLWYAQEAPATVTLAQVADQYTPATSYMGAQYKVKAAYSTQYFIFEGKIYSGTPYGTRNIPTLTDENKEYFNADHNFTNHARRNLGTCLPIGNKDQGFEYQCTADSGLDGSDIVAMCLANGTIDHPSQVVDSTDYWHLLVPTALPYTPAETGSLGNDALNHVSGSGSATVNLYGTSGNSNPNLFIYILKNGFSTTPYEGAGLTVKDGNAVDISSATAIVNAHGTSSSNAGLGLYSYVQLADGAFQRLLTWLNAQG